MKNKKVTQLFAGLMVTAMVVTGTVVPPTTAQAATKSVTIKTQAQLNAALKDPKVTSIVIKTSKGTTFKIKTGDYDNKKLVIASPKATVNNYGSFKKISVQDGKTFYDRGADNQIAVSDKNFLKLVTGKQSRDTDITITSKGAKISVVNNGKVDNINVKGKSSVTVSGNSKKAPTITANAANAKIVTAMDSKVVLNKAANLTVKAGCTLESLTAKADSNIKIEAGTTVEKMVIKAEGAKVDLTIDGTVGKIVVEKKADVTVGGATSAVVAIENNAADTTITSSVKTNVALNADAKISLEKGAEGSSVKAEHADVKAEVDNQTTEKVTITDASGKDTTVASGSTSGNTSGTETKPGNSNTGTTTGDGNGGGEIGGNGGTVTKKNFNATLPSVTTGSGIVSVTMDKVEGVKFYVNDVETAFTYADAESKYQAQMSKEGRYTIKITAAGYNDQTLITWYDVTAPVISGPWTGDQTESATDVYASDAATWNYATVTVKDNLDENVKLVLRLHDVTDAENEVDLADISAVRELLKKPGKKVRVTYCAVDHCRNSATEKSLVYTSKADVAATAVTIGGDAKTGYTLTANPTGNGSVAAGGGLTYQWKSCDTADGTYATIEGATAATYVIPVDAVGKFYKVEVTNPGSTTPISSDATAAVAEGELELVGEASYGEVLEHNTAPELSKLTAAFKNKSGQSVEVTLAFANSDSLTTTTDVSFTATATGYVIFNETVNIKVKATTPTEEEVKLATGETLNTIEVGKTAFVEAYDNMEYSLDGEKWSEITTAAFAVPENRTIYVHRTGAANAPSNSLPVTVTDGNIGTKKKDLMAVSITEPSLVKDKDQVQITGTITDANAEGLVADYTVQLNQGDTLIAQATVTDRSLLDVAMTLEQDQTFDYSQAYTVKVIANPSDKVHYASSAAGEGVIATNNCIVTVNLQDGTGVETQRVAYNTAIADLDGTPTREGYSFIGWYDAATGGKKITENITDNTTIYARWLEIQQLNVAECVFFTSPEGAANEGNGNTDHVTNDPNKLLSTLGFSVSGLSEQRAYTITGNLAESDARYTTANYSEVDDVTVVDSPVFLKLPIASANYNYIWVKYKNANGTEGNLCGWLSGQNDSAYKSWLDVDEDATYLKFGLTLAKKQDETWAATGKTDITVEVYNEIPTSDENAGYLVATMSFAIDSQVEITSGQ